MQTEENNKEEDEKEKLFVFSESKSEPILTTFLSSPFSYPTSISPLKNNEIMCFHRPHHRPLTIFFHEVGTYRKYVCMTGKYVKNKSINTTISSFFNKKNEEEGLGSSLDEHDHLDHHHFVYEEPTSLCEDLVIELCMLATRKIRGFGGLSSQNVGLFTPDGTKLNYDSTVMNYISSQKKLGKRVILIPKRKILLPVTFYGSQENFDTLPYSERYSEHWSSSSMKKKKVINTTSSVNNRCVNEYLKFSLENRLWLKKIIKPDKKFLLYEERSESYSKFKKNERKNNMAWYHQQLVFHDLAPIKNFIVKTQPITFHRKQSVPYDEDQPGIPCDDDFEHCGGLCDDEDQPGGSFNDRGDPYQWKEKEEIEEEMEDITLESSQEDEDDDKKDEREEEGFTFEFMKEVNKDEDEDDEDKEKEIKEKRISLSFSTSDTTLTNMFSFSQMVQAEKNAEKGAQRFRRKRKPETATIPTYAVDHCLKSEEEKDSCNLQKEKTMLFFSSGELIQEKELKQKEQEHQKDKAKDFVEIQLY